LVGLKPDIIVTSSTPTTVALQRETRTIPIVFAGMADPVAAGIVARLDRPSGNITGFVTNEASLGGKWLELLSEIAPGLKRAAIMFNPDTAPVSYMPSFETAARSLKVVPILAPVHSDERRHSIAVHQRDFSARMAATGQRTDQRRNRAADRAMRCASQGYFRHH
jgi:putative tryptophan/tyrosine transport system substrate-binding protein